MASLTQLREIMTRRPERVALFYPFLLASMNQYDILSTLRQAAFLATIAHESAELRYTTEVWGPTQAQIRYEGRRDLGNTMPGDGPKFRGRGLIQITGRANYQAVSEALHIDYVGDPSRMAEVPDASRTAAWWWATHGCNALADAGDFEAVTRRVNGALNGWESRLEYYNRALRVLARPDFGNVESGGATTAPGNGE